MSVPAAWVALEFLRSHLLSGFGWNLLGYSQTPWPALIQIADVTGVWGVSWLIVLVNVAIAGVLRAGKPSSRMAPLLIAAGCLIAAGLYGVVKLAQPLYGMPPPAPWNEGRAGVRVAVVQGNIPQEQKWDEAYRDAILERYDQLTHQAAAQQPDLIVWPEASVPGLLVDDEALTARIRRLTHDAGSPVLLGAPLSRLHQGVSRYTNSAVILGPDGSISARYDKLHLVPFGEFVPFESLAPWLREVLPPIGDFVPGHEYTVFETRDPSQTSDIRHQTSDQRPETRDQRKRVTSSLQSPVSSLASPFSVLICFEDIFPELARRFVQRGAQWLVTITNDAWFGNTAAPYQHAQASTFRAVELRVPMVRAANTGWSGCIDSRGRWVTSVRDPRGEELFVEGVAVCEVTVGDTPTMYRRWGDWFAWLCILGCLGGMFFAIMKR